MLFNSYTYIFLFLPFVVLVYFYLNYKRLSVIAKIWLIITSLLFYSYWNYSYLTLLLGSIIVNYSLGLWFISPKRILLGDKVKRFVLLTGIIFNIGLLAYYKYADFFITNFNLLSGSSLDLMRLTLPLAISFFTFQQIAFLLDCYRNIVKDRDFLDYCLFVSFFPQLIAGPIVHHREMMPQFARNRNKVVRWDNLSIGLMLFSVGLFKKVVIADTFSVWANAGFNNIASLSLFNSWIASLSYTCQLYFDFSGYTDMAVGSALLFNIKLPYNFLSPYKASNIQDFWRRWHITLGRWIRDYVYIPLGGNRLGIHRTSINIFVSFFLIGLWHGAGWTFILWGILHGIGSIIYRYWKKYGFQLPSLCAILITFLFVNFTWVIFRASTINDAINFFKCMLGVQGVMLPESIKDFSIWMGFSSFTFGPVIERINGSWVTMPMLLTSLSIIFYCRNSNELKKSFTPTRNWLIFLTFIIVSSLISLSRVNEFIYFQF